MRNHSESDCSKSYESDSGDKSIEEVYEKLYETYGTELYGKRESITDFRYHYDYSGIGGLIGSVKKIEHLLHLQNESEQNIARLTKIMQENDKPAEHVSEKLSLYTTRRDELPAEIEKLEKSIVHSIEYFMECAICFIIKYMKHPDNQDVIRITDAIDFYEKQKNKKIMSADEKKKVQELEKKKEELSKQITKKKFIEIEKVDDTVKELEQLCKSIEKLKQFDIKSVDLSILVSEIETKKKEYNAPEKKKALWREYDELWSERAGVYQEIAIISGDLDKLYDLLSVTQYDNCVWDDVKEFCYHLSLPNMTSDKKLELNKKYITGLSFFKNNFDLFCKSPKIKELCKHFLLHLHYLPVSEVTVYRSIRP